MNIKKTKVELLDEIKELKAQIEKLDKYKMYEQAAGELSVAIDAFTNAGFSRDEAMSILLAAVKMPR